MADRRLELHEELITIMPLYYMDGDEKIYHVYFQSPEKKKMKYPCIIYNISGIHQDFADNILYRSKRRYQIMLVDSNPDSEYVEKLLIGLPGIAFERFYPADSLNHWVYNLYY